jgi:hypothetical protein
MSSIPAPPPIRTEAREIHPIQMFHGRNGTLTDFGPHVLPSKAEVDLEAPKGVDAIFTSSEETLKSAKEQEQIESQETLPLESPESETELTLPKQVQTSVPNVETQSQLNSLPIGSSQTSTGSPAAPAPVPNTK